MGQGGGAASVHLLTFSSAHKRFIGRVSPTCFASEESIGSEHPQLMRCSSGDGVSHVFSVC